MIQMSLSEKLKILVDVSKSSGINLISILLIGFMASLFLTTNRKNAKSSKKIYMWIYIVIIGTLLLIYNSSLSTMFDYMMNNFFIGFYFPNLAIYLAAIIVTNIILLKTIFNFREDKLLKIINTIVYCLIHYLLVLILGLINSNKLDVFDQSSVYKNSDVSGLISLSSTIFIVWIIFMIIYKAIRMNQRKHQRVRRPIRRVIRYKKKLPDNYLTISIPREIYGTFGIPREKPKYVEDNLLDFYKQEEKELTNEYENMFSLDDYKKMIEILKTDKKDIKEENPPVIPIEEIKEQVSKEEVIPTNQIIENVEEQTEDLQPKLEELLNLYKSI